MRSRLCMLFGVLYIKNNTHVIHISQYKNTHFSTLEKSRWTRSLSMMTARGQPIYCESGDSHETLFEPFSDPAHVSEPGDSRPTLSLHRILQARPRLRANNNPAYAASR